MLRALRCVRKRLEIRITVHQQRCPRRVGYRVTIAADFEYRLGGMLRELIL
jgi:hypothetical protein